MSIAVTEEESHSSNWNRTLYIAGAACVGAAIGYGIYKHQDLLLGQIQKISKEYGDVMFAYAQIFQSTAQMLSRALEKHSALPLWNDKPPFGDTDIEELSPTARVEMEVKGLFDAAHQAAASVVSIAKSNLSVVKTETPTPALIKPYPHYRAVLEAYHQKA